MSRTGRMAVLGVTLLLSSCGEQDPGPRARIQLGSVIDRTGSVANPAWPAAVDLAVADANAALKAAGYPYHFLFEVKHSDSTNTPAVAAQRALELVRGGAKALITDTSADTIATNRLMYDADQDNNLDVPMVCQACTSPDINNPSASRPDPVEQEALRNGLGWCFRATVDSDPQAVVLMEIAQGQGAGGDVDQDGTFKYSVMAIDDAYGNGFADGLERAVRSLGFSAPPTFERVLHPRTATPDTYDWATVIAKLTDDFNEQTGVRDGPPDIIFEVDFPQFAAAFTAEWLNAGHTIRLLHTHNFRHDTVAVKLGARVVGQEGTSHVLVDDATSGLAFTGAFQAAHGRPPAFWASNTYDSAMTLMLATVLAIRKGQLDNSTDVTGAEIRDAMFAVSAPGGEVVHAGVEGFREALGHIVAGRPIDYEGASGPMDFDAHGNVQGRIARFKFQDGGFEDLDTYDCVANRNTCPLQ